MRKRELIKAQYSHFPHLSEVTFHTQVPKVNWGGGAGTFQTHGYIEFMEIMV